MCDDDDKQQREKPPRTHRMNERKRKTHIQKIKNEHERKNLLKKQEVPDMHTQRDKYRQRRLIEKKQQKPVC